MRIISFLAKSFLTTLLVIMTMSYKGSATKFRENSERLREKLKVPQSTWDAGLVSLAKFIKPILPNLSELIYPNEASTKPEEKKSTKNS